MLGFMKALYEDYINKILEELISSERKKFVLYPNGKITTIVKEILNSKYNISPEYIVDNYKFDGKNVLNLEQAGRMQSDNIYYLICSDNLEIYNEIRNKLKLYIRKEQIIDLFPDIPNERLKKEIYQELIALDNDIDNMVKKVCG